MKALVGAFNQEKALVGAFSVIVQPVVEPMEHYTALLLPLRKPVSGTASHIDIRFEFCLLGPGPGLGLARGRASSRRDTVTRGLVILRQPEHQESEDRVKNE